MRPLEAAACMKEKKQMPNNADGRAGQHCAWHMEAEDCEPIDVDPPADLPVITLGNLAENATAGERALLDAAVEIYQHCGKLVRPIVETTMAADGRTTQVARLEEVGAVYLRDLLARHAIWQIHIVRENKMARRDPSVDIAKTILARVGEWTFPAITAIISTPTMRPDGSLLTKPGYDRASGLLLVGPPDMPEIPLEPSRDDALRALGLLEDLLVEFPFNFTFSESVALSALVTPIVRGAFSVAPMHALSATAAGSGKSYLADIVASIAIGQPMPVMAAGRTEEETEKRLGAALMAGQPLISIDNVTGGLGGDALCVAVERSSVRMRVLGHSQQARIEARGTTFFATGNNLVIVGDMCRRVITIRLDPQLERPELRVFKANPVAKVMANRGAYIAACLTICRAYIAAGKPHRAQRLASFEGWSDIVRSALIWLGKDDPVYSMDLQRDLDPERIGLCAMLEAWADAIGVGDHTRCTLADVIKAAKNKPDLAAAIEAVAGRKQKPDARSLGLWLRNKKGTVVGNNCFSNYTNKKGVTVWWVEDLAR
jgi:putative DNA primase/helicase